MLWPVGIPSVNAAKNTNDTLLVHCKVVGSDVVALSVGKERKEGSISRKSLVSGGGGGGELLKKAAYALK